MKYMLLAITSLLSSMAPAHEVVGIKNNHILENGLPSQKLRLFSAEDPKRCLSAATLEQRQVVQWSNKCDTEASIFVYEDGGGFTSLNFNSGDYVTIILKTNLPKEYTVPFLPENMFVASNLTQEEFIHSISPDLILQNDGSYIIGDYDEEAPAKPIMCFGKGTQPEAINLGSVELVSMTKNSCAKIQLKKI